MITPGCPSKVNGAKVICLGTCEKMINQRRGSSTRVDVIDPRPIPVNPIGNPKGMLVKVFPSDYPLGYPSLADVKFKPCEGERQNRKSTKVRSTNVFSTMVEVDNFFHVLSELSPAEQGEGVPHPFEGRKVRKTKKKSPKKGPQQGSKKGPKKDCNPMNTPTDFRVMNPPINSPVNSTAPPPNPPPSP